MELNERLKELIGHEVHVQAYMEKEDGGIPGGTLKEVGLDYILIETKEEEQGGHAIKGADWWVRLATTAAIFHPHDCPKCAVDAAI